MSQEAEGERPGLRRAIAALRHRNYRLFFIATLVSSVGGSLQGAANLWQIFVLTDGSAVHLGLTGLARLIPIVAFSFVGGVAADRMDRKRITMFTQGTAGIISLLLGVLSITGLIQVWHIYVLTFLGASVSQASTPARDAITANLVPREHLTNAVSLNSGVLQLGRIGGPSLAGVVIASVGLPLTYLLNGVAHLVTFVMLSRIYLGSVPTRPRGNAWQNFVEGLAFVRYRSIILVLLMTDLTANLFGSYEVLLPIISDNFGTGPIGFGALAAAPGVGAILATTLIVSLGDVPYKGRLVIGCALVFAVALVGLALAPWFPLALLACFILGATDSGFTVLRNAVIQLVTPDALRGRVGSFRTLLTTAPPALGLSLMGAAATLLSPAAALIIGAVSVAVSNVGLYAARPDVRARDLGSETLEAEVKADEAPKVPLPR